MASITVWLTSYHHAPFLRESIESILNQTWSDFEFYIIDDCSTDNSWEIIQSYQDPRIHAIRHETNWGSSGMWQILESLTGEYLAIAHCDDKWMPDKLEKQLAFLQKHPEVAACFTRVQVIDENGHTGVSFGEEKVFLDDARGRKPEVLAYVGKEVIMGIRPESMFDDEASLQKYNRSVISVHVYLVEMMGSETYLYLLCQGKNFTARVSARSTARTGDDLKIALEPDRIHLFDASTERTILS